MTIYFCGGSCIEDVSNHLMTHLYSHPTLRTCSSDTILRAISELSSENLTYTSNTDKVYKFNAADKVNDLLLDSMSETNQLKSHDGYTLDVDHQFLETEKYDTKMTYKRFRGYSPGVAVIDDLIVGIENRDGNTNVRFHQQDTQERIYTRLENHGIHIQKSRMDCGSCSRKIVEMIAKHSKHYYIRANRCASIYDSIFALKGWKQEEIGGIEYELNSILAEKWEGEYTYRCIITNDYESPQRDIVDFYNQRGAKEPIFDEMNNGLGWNRLPKSFMAENTVFLLLTALIRNFYKLIISNVDLKDVGLKPTSRIKAFVFRFISVTAKWIKTARQYVLKRYTTQKAYSTISASDFG